MGRGGSRALPSLERAGRQRAPRVLLRWLLSSQACLPLEHCRLWGRTEGSGAGRGICGAEPGIVCCLGSYSTPESPLGLLSRLIV